MASIPVRAALLVLLLSIVFPVSGTAGEQNGIPLLVTVDDLPISSGSLHPEPGQRREITERMLAVLNRHGIRAVGLVTWRNVKGDADLELLARWLEEGHELGNHSYHHPSYTRTTATEYIRDMESGRKALAEFLEPHGRQVRFFRFPMLREGETPEKLQAMRRYLEYSGQANLPVTLDNQDYVYERPWVEAVRAGDEAEMKRVATAFHESLHLSVRHHCNVSKRLFDREVPQILLLHAGAVGAAQWDDLFTWLQGEGFRFASTDDVLSDPAFAVKHEYAGPRGIGLWDRILTERERQEAERQVAALLREQSAAWSAGDLEAFTSVYADDAVFVTPKGLTRGRAEVYERYRESYPDRAAMGTLKLETLEVTPFSGVELSMLGDSRPGGVHALTVIARWSLSYPEDSGKEDAAGLTLIVFRRKGRSWEIVQDASM
jgi:peptidoglycan/xylan/chitin deacetylase (PgdA/CDA1 family)/ketosteroid isomerase-like protein